MKSIHGTYRWQNGCYYNTQTRCEAFAVYYLNHFDGSRFRRYRAFRDETCGSFVYERPQMRASASRLLRCAERLETCGLSRHTETFGVNGIDKDSHGLRVKGDL